jgi:protein required for attachment to host cells
MARIPAGAWVMVGDGEKALFLRNDGDEAFPNLTVVREAFNAGRPNDEGAKTPGVRSAAGPGALKTVVQESDFQRVAKSEFAREVAARLYKSAHRGEYDKLIVAAPPTVLGELRKALHKEVESRLLFDLAKELTNQPVDQIEKALAAA